jgi:hypothetical protein
LHVSLRFANIVITNPNLMTSNQIKRHLLENKGYFKWSLNRLVNKYGCSDRIMQCILRDLGDTKTEYLRSLKS